MTKHKGKANHRSKMFGSFRRELLLKEDGQEYALITKILGNGHMECTCMDDTIRRGNIRGKMRRRTWICLGDVVLCGLRDFQDNCVDIIHKYNADEVAQLVNLSELPPHIGSSDSKEKDKENDIDFTAESIIIDAI